MAWPSMVVLMVSVIMFDFFLKLHHKKPSSLDFFYLSMNPNTIQILLIVQFK